MRRSRWMYAPIGMVLGAATLAVLGSRVALVRQGPPWREGAALLKVELPRPLLDEAAEAEADQRLRLDTHRRTVAALMVSPNVLSAAVGELRSKHPTLLGSKSDPVEWLGNALRVDEVGEQLLAVSMPGASRGDQARVVNAVVEEYLVQHAQWEQGALKVQIDRAVDALAQSRQDLAIKRRELREGNADPERQAALRDEVAILEELTRRLALGLGRLRLEREGAKSVIWVANARP